MPEIPRWLDRTERLIGADSVLKLQNSRVALLGLGGVGGAALEVLARAGISSFLLADPDVIDDTNRNRQFLATTETVGLPKVLVAERRVLAINPEAEVYALQERYSEENCDWLFSFRPDIIVDAIDSVSAKLYLAESCMSHSLPLICCLGTGNRLDPTALRAGDLFDTPGCGCPLARVMRNECRKRGIARLAVVYSTERPASVTIPDGEHGRHSPASVSTVPAAAGILIASAAMRALTEG